MVVIVLAFVVVTAADHSSFQTGSVALIPRGAEDCCVDQGF